MVKMRFFDDNTRSWTPDTGGASIPALDDLLAPLGIAFGDKILNGGFSINGEHIHYAFGTNIMKYPRGGHLHSFEFQDNSESGAAQNILSASGMTKVSPILGLMEVGKGSVAVYGDSNCLDSSHMVTNCYWLLRKILDFTNRNVRDPVLFADSAKTKNPLHVDESQLPLHRTDVNFPSYSSVARKELICHHDSRFEVWETKGCGLQLIGGDRKPTIDMGSDLNISMMGSNVKVNEATIQKSSGSHSGTVERNKSRDSIDFLGLLNHDEVDIPMLVAGQWMILLLVALTCLLLYLRWGMRQKR